MLPDDEGRKREKISGEIERYQFGCFRVCEERKISAREGMLKFF
jgi:hypothetical protein